MKPLLRRLLHAAEDRVRSAAVSVLRYNTHRIADHADLLMAAAADPHGRVRLEAIIAGSWLDNADGARIALEALKLPLDKWMGPVTKHILEYTLKDDIAALQAAGKLDLADNPNAAGYLAGTFKIEDAAPSAEDAAYGPHPQAQRRRTKNLRARQASLHPRRPLRHLPSAERSRHPQHLSHPRQERLDRQRRPPHQDRP
jgi:hypothetical protein